MYPHPDPDLDPSQLYEEGECFIAHLGLGEEWGELVEKPTAMMLPDESGSIVEVAAGNLHSLLLGSSGSIWSVGAGWEGPLGHGDMASTAIPRPVVGLSSVRIERIAAGDVHSLALSGTGEVWSWGWGAYGQLGHGATASLTTPRRIEHLPCVVQISAGSSHSLFVCSRGRVHTCGRADDGQCGHGPARGARAAEQPEPELLPRVVEALAGLQVVAARAEGEASYAVVRSGERYAWGAQLGLLPMLHAGHA